jgi:hypothetical protein
MPATGTQGFHDALVALACDTTLRESFERQGPRLLDRFGLDARAERALLAIPLAALSRYGESLLAKRKDEFARVIPITRMVCPSVVSRYASWLSRHPAEPIDSVLGPGEREALRALEFLRGEIARAPEEAPYAADVLTHEVLRVCSLRDGRRRLLRTRFALPAILADLNAGLVPTDPDEQPHELIYDGPRVRFRAVAP